MFYETADNDHGLPRDPFKSLVVPRPIGWVTTCSRDGAVNLAPYSFFNAVAAKPPIVMFSSNGASPSEGDKDSLTNCEATGEFVVNLATWDLREAMNLTSTPAARGVNEMGLAGLEALPSRMVRPPRVKGTPVHLECRYLQTVELPCEEPVGCNAMVLGQVVGIHIDDAVLTEGLVDMSKLKPIARLGYMDYTRVDLVFTMERPQGA